MKLIKILATCFVLPCEVMVIYRSVGCSIGVSVFASMCFCVSDWEPGRHLFVVVPPSIPSILYILKLVLSVRILWFQHMPEKFVWTHDFVWRLHFREHTVQILSELGQKKKIIPWRCTPTNLSHQGYIVETQQSSAVIENELRWQCSQSWKSGGLGASDSLWFAASLQGSLSLGACARQRRDMWLQSGGNNVGCNNWLDIGCSSQCLRDTPVTDSTCAAELD